ncbi:hypothetical protein ACFVH6_11400 [Spirillospora sp. NPDC127200]
MGEGRHTGHCENATRPKCVCRGCGGAEHGWPGALQIASDTSGRKLAKLTDAANKQWEELSRIRHPNGKPTDKARRAAVKGALAAVTAWLHRNGDLRARLAAVGDPLRHKPAIEPQTTGRKPRRPSLTPEEQHEFVQTHIIPRLTEEFGQAKVEEFQARAVEAHFWCELFAQTARALDECRNLHEKAKQFIVDALSAENEPHPALWARVLPYQDVTRKAVDLVFELLPQAAGLPAPDGMFQLIWPVRLLACLICKDPSEHETVRRYCLNPILQQGEAQARAEVLKHMAEVFPNEWPAQQAGP